MKRLVAFLSVMLMVLGYSMAAFAHCEVPCGIYDDEMRIKQMAEDITTIEKAMNQIMELQRQSPVNYNQLVRWIDNKEEHAGNIQHIVTQYFMTQRLTPTDPDHRAEHDKYLKELELLQRMLYHAMKSKQTTDLVHVDRLKVLLAEFDNVYFNRGMQEQAPAEQPKQEESGSIFDQLQKRLGK